MSLLMEALRKAEEAKRRMQQEEQAAAGRDSRDAAERSQADDSTRGDSPFTLEEREPVVTPQYIRDNFTTPQHPAAPANDAPAAQPDVPAAQPAPQPPASTDPPARNLSRRQQRAAAASVFAAKQNPARNRKTLTILVIVMVLMIPLGGGVLWYLQSAAVPSLINPEIADYDLSSRGFVGDTPPAPAGTAAATSPATAATPATAPQNAAVAAETPGATAAAETTATVATVEDDVVATEASTDTSAPQDMPEEIAPDVTARDVADAQPPPLPLDAPIAASAQADTSLALPEAESNSVLEVSRTRGTTQVNPDLATAYTQLQAGDFEAASRLYQDVLYTLPNNRDALLGLALAHMRLGQQVSARELYARLLQLNPRDPLAHTGLLQTMQVSDPAEHENTLRKLISQYPDVAQLTLALGNLYAAQQRWSEAQAAYYNALLTASRATNGPVHPDYAFNLAVSLEQLGEPKAALTYYRQARELAADLTPGFDPQLLSSRLTYLEQAQP